ncbi:MAG: lactate utilization protein [Hyphomicrobiales bacterium]|nr:lactate utilization protein [Hyphomicrobiales bacterium]
MSGRDAVLGKVRQALGAGKDAAARQAAVDERLAAASRGVIPARGQLPDEERIAFFVKMAEKYNASVARIADADDVPAAIAEFLRAHNLPPNIKRGDDPRLAALPFEKTPNLEISIGASDGDDLVGLSHALAGVAESGTLVLTSGRDNPTTLNFLPDTHIVLVSAADIHGDYETAWDDIRKAHDKGALPRTVNWVTGPSRSADIEQTLLLGAHGPRRLHIIIVG